MSTDGTKAAITKTEETPVKSLKTYYKNPRVGNVKKIAKSLHINGQFRPLVVNIGTYTKRKNEVLAGNHTLLAAREEVMWQESGESYHKKPWTKVWASFVDVDEATAKRIVLADNRTADDGTYDEKLLAELLEDIPDLSATGYDEDEVAQLLADIGDFDDLDEGELDSYEEAEERGSRKPKYEETPIGDEDEAEDDEPRVSVREQMKQKAQREGVDLDKVSPDLVGNFQLRDDPFFDLVGEFEFPRLLSAEENGLMLPEDIPEKLSTWAGSATRDLPENEDPDHFWFYNYGVDSTSGMQHVKNVICSFFTFDDYFEGVWSRPPRFTGKLLNTGIKYVCTPDFSPQTEMGKTFALWQNYRSRYLGRYFQDAGLKLLPHPIWPDGDIEFLDQYVLPTFPDIPVLLLQTQTIDPEAVTGGIDHYKKQLQHVISTVKPEVLVLYTGKPGLEIVESLKLGKTKVRSLRTRQNILSEAAKGRERKTTL